MDPSDFILGIYEFLEHNQICFLYGALVLDDPNGRIFDFLLSHEVYDKKRSTGFGATHMLFINSAKFRKRRRSSAPAAAAAAEVATSYNLDRQFSRRHYELPFNPPLNYICKRSCRTGELPKEECASEEASKGVLLFHPFKIVSADGSHSRQYIYLKLEGHLHDKSQHIASAFKRYVLHREKTDKYKKRREDDKIVQHHLVDNVQMLRAAGDAASRIKSELEFYDQHVRVGNEVYIPDGIMSAMFGTVEI